MLGDPEAVRFLGGSTLSREESWRKMLAGRAVWEMLGYGYWSVERRDDGAYVGQLGFADFKRDMIPSIEGAPEAGWLIAPHAQKQGYAAEAMLAALNWADQRLNVPEIRAIIGHENEASIRLARKLGFDRSEDALYRGEPILLFRRNP